MIEDKELMKLEEKLHEHQQQIEGIRKLYEMAYTGRIVTLLVGKYKGRQARIDGVGVDWDGLSFVCMVLRVDGTGVLNSDGESRSYWARGQFEFYHGTKN